MSMWGKAEFKIVTAERANIYVTVASTVTIKQGADLVRLSFKEAEELAADLAAGLDELRKGNPLTERAATD